MINVYSDQDAFSDESIERYDRWDAEQQETTRNDDTSDDDNFLSQKKSRKKSKLIKSGSEDEKAKDNDKLDSSSGDEDSECCAICLGKLTSKKLPSKPDSGCEHMFCRECLVEWSKQVRQISYILKLQTFRTCSKHVVKKVRKQA